MDLLRAVKPAVLGAVGIADPPVREAAFHIGAGTAPARTLPEPLGAFLAKVERHAYQVVDGDVDALRRAGYSDDTILEVTLAVAVGAGLSRLERGLAALADEG